MIECRNISKRFGSTPVLREVTFHVPDNTIAVILGRSGSGKTTLLRIVAGLDQADSGEVRINGVLVDSAGFHEPPAKRGIGMVFQTPALWPHLTVREHILFALPSMPVPLQEERIRMLCVTTGLAGLEGRYPDELSGGQARRVALARAFAGRPRCLLLDEPLTSLDPDLRNALLPLLKSMIRESGASALYVTHDHAEAKNVGDIILTLEGGLICTAAAAGPTAYSTPGTWDPGGDRRS